MRPGKKAITSALAVSAVVGVLLNCASPVESKPEKKAAAVEQKSHAKDGHVYVDMETTKGPITMEIFEKEAPITSANFIDLVNKHFYDGLTFHRYEPGFVIQGGDPLGNGSGNYIDPKTHKERHIKLEKNPKLRHDAAGMVAMARTSDPNSASCQFYITLAPAEFLDNPPGYAVFGKVIEGLPNVMKLRAGDKMTKVTVEK